MTDMKRRPGADRGDVDDLLAGGVGTDPIPRQLRRRRAASRRCEPLRSGLRDPADPTPTESVTERELASWRTAWWHLDRLGLPAIIPEKVLATAGSRGGAS
jgi:hypothetical protein